MNYYYFVDNEILTTSYEINLQLNPSYVPFTEEQTEFYEEHPDASYWEVKNCRLDPQPTPPSLDHEKANAIDYLSNLSLETLDRYVKEYQLANAQSSIYLLSKNPKAVTVYDEEHANEVIVTYNVVGHELRVIFKAGEEEINGCKTVSEVYVARDKYETIYREYEYNNDKE